jgi:hypothetical protein
VAFNTESKKYHCLDCEWARRCTMNCIRISLSEARRRGGVACKVCGGTCGRSVQEQASQPLESQHHEMVQQASPKPCGKHSRPSPILNWPLKSVHQTSLGPLART